MKPISMWDMLNLGSSELTWWEGLGVLLALAATLAVWWFGGEKEE